MDEFQRFINKMIGVTDGTWEKYNPVEKEREKRIQAISLKMGKIEESINKLMGMVPHIKNIREADEIQGHINAMMGIPDEVWAKYGPN